MGKEIRWADLVYLREAWEDIEQKKRGFGKGQEGDNEYEGNHAQGYRVSLAQLLLHTSILILDRPLKSPLPTI